MKVGSTGEYINTEIRIPSLVGTDAFIVYLHFGLFPYTPLQLGTLQRIKHFLSVQHSTIALETVSRKPEDLRKLADVHPELDAWVKANGAPPKLNVDPIQQREIFVKVEQRFADIFSPKDISDIVVESITVPARDGHSILVKKYSPKEASAPGPLIIEIHGRGFGDWHFTRKRVALLGVCQGIRRHLPQH